MGIADYMLAALFYSAPIIIAALGESLVERAGRVNLGVEGMMALGASISVALSSLTGSIVLGILGGAVAGVALSLVYIAAVIMARLNQFVVGLLISFTGLGLADLVASMGHKIGPEIPQGSESHILLVSICIVTPPALYIMLSRTPTGIEIRAIGHDESTARERGLRVDMLRSIAIAFGGIMAGIDGSYISLALHGGKYFSGITAGMGWIAVGSVILGYWNPLGVAIAGYAIGIIMLLRPQLASMGIGDFIASSTPYIAIIIALALASIFGRRSLGSHSIIP